MAEADLPSNFTNWVSENFMKCILNTFTPLSDTDVMGVTKHFLIGLKAFSSVIEAIPATIKGAKNVWLNRS